MDELHKETLTWISRELDKVSEETKQVTMLLASGESHTLNEAIRLLEDKVEVLKRKLDFEKRNPVDDWGF